MKIGLSSTSVEPNRRGRLNDGIGHYTHYLMNRLRDFGHETTGYAYPPLFGPKPVLEFGHYLPFSMPVTASLATTWPQILRRLTPPCDIFHVTDFKVFPMKVPVVATVFDTIPLLHPEWLSHRIRYAAPFLIRRLVPLADHIIVATEHAAQNVREQFSIPEDQISIVPWGIDAAWLNPVEDDLRESVLLRYGLEPGFILNVGTIQPRKNIEGLLDAYMLLPSEVRGSHKLVIAGRFGWGSKTLLSRLRIMSEEGVIAWLRDVDSDEDIRALYASAHLFVFPSLYEGFGIPLLEAFASGVPVVSSNLSCLPEVSSGAALLTDPTNAPEMADAIHHLVRDTADRIHYRRLGMQRARELSLEQALKKTIEVYHHVLASGRRMN